MKITERLQEIPYDNWKNESQHMEWNYWVNNPAEDDYNNWWFDQFEQYKYLDKSNIKTIAEVGCGPNAKNVQLFLLDKSVQYFISDPLLEKYIQTNKPVKRFIDNYNVVTSTSPLEEYKIEPVDCVVCINVLDHVYNLKQCFESIYNNLKPGGIFVLGNELTSQADMDRIGLNDPNAMMHPIRFDLQTINTYLQQYKTIKCTVLPREMGRAPESHYATILFVGQKI